jgi:predicted acyl esterase
MNKYKNQSKSKQVHATQQMLSASHPDPVVAAMLTHEDIARHAHEIYVEKGRRQGQSEQDWLQAEQELKNQQHRRQAGRDMKNQDQAGNPAAC